MSIKCPDKCEHCEYRKIIHSVLDYNFCTKIHKSFCGYEPEGFFNCGK